MTDQPQQQGEPPVLYAASSAIGKALGIVAAVLVTPAVYEWTRAPLLRYLARTYGPDLAQWLSWGLAIVEGVLIYYGVLMAFTFGLSWAMAWLVARSLSR